MIEIREYIDRNGRSPYARWFDRLNAQAAAKVATAIVRIGQGNFASAKGVGGGLFEARVNFGPGYRIYFGRDGGLLVILLPAAPSSANRKTSIGLERCGRTTRHAKVRR